MRDLFEWERVPTFVGALKGTTSYSDSLGLSRKTRKKEFGLSVPFVQLLGTDLWEGNQGYNLLKEMGGCIAIKRSMGS